MNIKSIKASYLKLDSKNYYLYNGYHIQKIGSYYVLTWLYNCEKFKTLGNLKKYINKN